MTTITATDLATVRRLSGDYTQPYDLTDAEIDAIYTSSASGSSDLYRTAFFVAEQRWGIATNAIAVSNPMGGLSRNQKFDQIWRALTYLGEKTGLYGDSAREGGFAGWSATWP